LTKHVDRNSKDWRDRLGEVLATLFIVVGILSIVVATFRFVRTGRLLDDSSIHSPGILPDLVFAVIISSLLIALSAYLVLS
jgi:uncharacterized membrane protein YidH (DUF202 family)